MRHHQTHEHDPFKPKRTDLWLCEVYMCLQCWQLSSSLLYGCEKENNYSYHTISTKIVMMLSVCVPAKD